MSNTQRQQIAYYWAQIQKKDAEIDRLHDALAAAEAERDAAVERTRDKALADAQNMAQIVAQGIPGPIESRGAYLIRNAIRALRTGDTAEGGSHDR